MRSTRNRAEKIYSENSQLLYITFNESMIPLKLYIVLMKANSQLKKKNRRREINFTKIFVTTKFVPRLS